MNDSSPVERQQWADAPYPLIETPKYKAGKTGYTDPYMETASVMAIVHNSFLRGLNSIYIQGPNIQPADYTDFIGYSLCWHSAVHEHHTGEEDYLFPEIEKAGGEKGLLDINVEQHRAFQPGLDEFNSYLKGLAGKESSFDAARLNGIIASFAPALCEHLAAEIPSLLALSRFGTKIPIEDLSNKEGNKTAIAMTKFSALPFFILNIDITYENYLWKDWPPMPSPARWAITHCFTLCHPGYWKFASCDQSGMPKPLYAQGPRG